MVRKNLRNSTSTEEKGTPEYVYDKRNEPSENGGGKVDEVRMNRKSKVKVDVKESLQKRLEGVYWFREAIHKSIVVRGEKIPTPSKTIQGSIRGRDIDTGNGTPKHHGGSLTYEDW